MFALESGRARRTIASSAVVLGLLAASCVSTVDRADPETVEPSATETGYQIRAHLGSSMFGELEPGSSGAALAFSDTTELLPAAAPSGTPYRTCVIDYRTVDWTTEPQIIVESHSRAGAIACAEEPWFLETAFQNGILTFMVLVGEANLAAAAPASPDPATMAASLRQQGFDRLSTAEIARSGPCEEGEIQAALFTLAPYIPTPVTPTPADPVRLTDPIDGLASMLESAAANGATVEPGQSVTVITGAGAPCVTAVVHSRRIVGWITSADRTRLDAVVAGLRLPAVRPWAGAPLGSG